MRTTHILATLLLTAVLASCADIRDAAVAPSADEICLDAYAAAATKAPVTGTTFPEGWTIRLSAYHTAPNGTVQEYFSDVPFTRQGTVWKAGTAAAPNPKYWPSQGTLTFFARTAMPAGTAGVSADPDERVATVGDNSASQTDILFAMKAPMTKTASAVPMVFYHQQALVAFRAKGAAYDATNNIGFTVTGVDILDANFAGTLTATRSGDAVATSWSALTAQKDAVVVPGVTTTRLTAAFQTLGTGLLVPGQPARAFRVHYTFHDGKTAAGVADDKVCTYTYAVPAGAPAWAAGRRYVYELTFSLEGITVVPVLEDWADGGSALVEVQGTPDETLDYMRLEVSAPGTLLWQTGGAEGVAATARTLEYSVNGSSWSQWTSTAEGERLSVAAGDVVKLRGAEAVYVGSHLVSEDGARFAAAGNSMSLFDRMSFETLTTVPASGLFGFFADCEGLTDASTLRLPATSAAASCYREMFRGCTALMHPPVLPATAAGGSYCYREMFRGCTALTEAPALPMRSIPTAAYYGMFWDCSSLIDPPSLPATTLRGVSVYCYMFRGCLSLRSAPSLPATALQANCYQGMFYDCISLRQAPASLPATTIPTRAYYSMFYQCVSLATAPSLPATSVGGEGYRNMFTGCTDLAAAPELPATTLGTYAYYGMFSGCSSLTSAPAVLPATTVPTYAYAVMFQDCVSLAAAPSLPATTVGANAYTRMFYGCTALAQAPASLPALAPGGSAYYEMFYGCTALTTAPAIAATTVGTYTCYRMFYGCTALTQGPPALHFTVVPHAACYYMFYNCRAMTSMPSLRFDEVSTSACTCMFYSCTAAAGAPVLAATTLAESCYYGMFSGCRAMTSVTMLATDISAYRALYSWMNNVAAAGTLTKAAATTLPSGASGIPAGWTVVNQ